MANKNLPHSTATQPSQLHQLSRAVQATLPQPTQSKTRTQAKVNVRLASEGGEMERQQRPRGTGSIYSIKGSSVLWIKYYRNGVPIRESSGSSKVKTAEKLLRTRLGAIS